MTIIVCSTEIFLSEQEVTSVWIEMIPINLDFPHSYEVVCPGRQRTRVDKQRVGVMFSPEKTILYLKSLRLRGGLTVLERRRLLSGEPRPAASLVASVSC